MKDEFRRKPDTVKGLMTFLFVLALVLAVLNPFFSWIFGSIILNISTLNGKESGNESIEKLGKVFFYICIAAGVVGIICKYVLHLYTI
ncbi:MAG: hypothetical protein II695_07130 [Oscillospiraceae bacterium]|nr:hypothetical protein [Oscillospiraceae bacterium]